MEPVLFYGIPHGCSFGSIVALEWLGQPYRLCRIDMLNKPAGYDRFNASQETPALLLESGETLSESIAVLHNIAARDPALTLAARQGTADFDRLNRMIAFLHTNLHGAFSPAWHAFKLADTQQQEKDFLRGIARDQAAKHYARLDGLLADGRSWLVNGRRSIADAYLTGIARWGEDLRLFDLRSDYPRLQAHLDRLAADPAVQFAQAIEEGHDAAKSGGGFRGHVTVAELQQRRAA